MGLRSWSLDLAHSAGEGYGKAMAKGGTATATAVADVPAGPGGRLASEKGPPVDHMFWNRIGLDPDALGIEDPYSNHPWLHRVLRIRMENALLANFVVDDRQVEGLQPQTSGELAELWRRPNPGMTRDQFWGLTILWLDLRGEVFWILDRKRPTEIPTAIWPWSGGDRWEVEAVDEQDVPTRWKLTRPDGDIKLYEAWEIVHFAYWDPDNPNRGIAPLESGRTFIETDILAAAFNREFFKNGAQPGGVLKVKGNLNTTQRRALWRDWEDKHRGVAKSWRPAILEGGMEWVQTTLTHEDMLFLEQFKWNRDGMAGLYGVPKFLLSVTEDINRATAFAAKESLWKNALLPLLRCLEMAIDSQLFMTIENGRFEPVFDTSMIAELQGDLTVKWEIAGKQRAAGVPFVVSNDNLKLGITKRFEGDDVSWVPATQIPAKLALEGGTSEAAEQAAALQEAKAAVALEIAGIDSTHLTEAEWDELLGELDDEERAAWAGLISSLSNAERQTIAQDRRKWNAWNKIVLEKSEKRMLRVFKPYFTGLTAAQLEKFDTFVATTQRSGGGPTVSTKVITEEDLLAILLDADVWGGILEAAYRPAAVQVGRLSQAFTEAELIPVIGPQAVVDPASDALQDFINARVTKVTRVSDTAIRQLGRTLRDGIGNGESIDQLRARIESVGDSLTSPKRSLTIARTESGTVASGMRFQVAGAVGVEFHRWVTAADEVVRDTHVVAAARSRLEPVRVGLPFSNGLLHPLDPEGAAAEVINCRCVAVLLPKKRKSGKRPPLTGRHAHLAIALGAAADAAEFAGLEVGS